MLGFGVWLARSMDWFIRGSEGSGNVWSGSGVVRGDVSGDVRLLTKLGGGVGIGLYTGVLGLYGGGMTVSNGGGVGLLRLEYFQGSWGQIPPIKSSIRISGTKFGKMSRGSGLTVYAEVNLALCLEMTHSAT